MNFEEIVQRAVNAKAKTGLRSSTMVQDSNICCSKGHCFSNSTASKIQTQRTIAKNFHPEELKVKKTRPTLSWAAEASKPLKQVCKEKKKKRYPESQYKKEQTPVSTANTTEVQQKKNKNWDCNISEVMYYNCNQKGHYANICTKPNN